MRLPRIPGTEVGMERIEGTVEQVIFENEENGYAVCDISMDGQMVTLTGYMPNLNEGEFIAAHGSWTTHIEYGEQFKVEYYEKMMPSTEREIEKYMASGLLPGVGKATAKRIVEEFGADALNVIEHEPDRLTVIKGMTAVKAEKIHLKYIEQIGVREVVMFFQQYGLSPALAVKAFKTFGFETVKRAQENPYILADEVTGISFSMADRMAMEMGMEKNSFQRISSGIQSLLQNSGYMSGHTFLPAYSLAKQAESYLEADLSAVEDAISQMLLSGLLVKENMGEIDAVYLRLFYEAECYVAQRLRLLSETVFEIRRAEAEELIHEIEEESGIELAEAQLTAVRTVLENSAMVITGGPGTGKTTIINTIIRMMKRMHKRVALAAPTGRAAKRITELSGMEAKTIHRLLEITPGVDEVGQAFARNESNTLDCDILIVDEMSMVDIMLMKSLLAALPIGARLVMVGDCDQLPSVGAGNVLRDIIDSDMLSCIKLTEIFRQAKESMIVVNSHKINNGEYPVLNEKDNDFFFVRRDDPYRLCETIADLCESRLPNYYHVDGIMQIQVLTPTRKTPIGVTWLNQVLQARLNPPDPLKMEKSVSEGVFRVGDKVMQIRNNYQLEWERSEDGEKGSGIFNGDVGIITDIDLRNRVVKVNFDDKIVSYDFLILDELELAYAITVHKSQGSEFDVVVIPMFETPRPLMTRNLLYTAVTRAKTLVVLVGREDIMKTFIDNNNVVYRFSGLKEKLKIY